MYADLWLFSAFDRNTHQYDSAFTTIPVCSCTLVGSQLSTTPAACDRSPSYMPITEMNEYTPVSVQWRRCPDCLERLTPVVCDR